VWICMEGGRTEEEVRNGRGWGYYVRPRWVDVWGDDPSVVLEEEEEVEEMVMVMDPKGKGKGKSLPDNSGGPNSLSRWRNPGDDGSDNDDDEEMGGSGDDEHYDQNQDHVLLHEDDVDDDDWVVPDSDLSDRDRDRGRSQVGRRIADFEWFRHQTPNDHHDGSDSLQRERGPQLVPNVDTEMEMAMAKIPDPFLYEGSGQMTQEIHPPFSHDYIALTTAAANAQGSREDRHSRSQYDFDYEALSQSNLSVSSHSVHSSNYHSFQSPFNGGPSGSASLAASVSISTPASHVVFHHPSFTSLHAQVQVQAPQTHTHTHNQLDSSSTYQFDNYRYGTSPYDDSNYYDAFEKMFNMNLESMYDRTGTTGTGAETEEGFYDTRLLYESVLAEDSGAGHLHRMHGEQVEEHRHRGDMQDGDAEEKYGFVEIDVPSFMWN
jgi:hypothetical protein